MKSRFAVSAICGLLSFAAFSVFSSEAQAALVTRTNCSVLAVAVDGAGGLSRLVLDISCAEGRTNVYGYFGHSCSISGVNASKETLEGWRSLAQAALLSGRKVNVNYDNAGTCGSAMYSINMW